MLCFWLGRVTYICSFLCCVFGGARVTYICSFLCCVFGGVRVTYICSFLCCVFGGFVLLIFVVFCVVFLVGSCYLYL